MTTPSPAATSQRSSTAATATATTETTTPCSSSCPICLDDLKPSETIYEIPCEGCGDYNYCSDCITNFCQAADDDWGVASDGSRQVKVSIACPQCRTKYSAIDLRQVVLLRKAYMLGTRLVDSTSGELRQDSNLNASELRYKRDLISSPGLRGQLQDAQIIYDHGYWKGKKKMKKKEGDGYGDNDVAQQQQEQKQKQLEGAAKVWKDLISKLPIDETGEGESGAAENEDGGSNEHSSHTIGTSHSNDSQRSSGSNTTAKNKMVDETLFQGLDEFMNRDEKLFLTDLLTSNDSKLLAQAAMIMHGMLRLSWSGKRVASAKSAAPALSKYESQKHIDYMTRTKAMFPLPNHMPGYVLIPAFSKIQGYMLAKDIVSWDGTMEPPQQSKRIFDHVYKDHYVLPSPQERRDVVSVSSIRGPVGRVGLRKNDRITHVNDMPWDGNAGQLMDYVYDCYERHPNDEISLTVNADKETAQFLHTRYNMMKKSRQEAAAANIKNNNNKR